MMVLDGQTYDVVVIGGGAAGLNGALMLARMRRSVLVIDAGSPRNAPADAVHGLFARDGVPPAELLATGRAEVRHYGGRVTTDEVTSLTRTGLGFRLRTAAGRTVHARRILLTTGLVDELPQIPGLREHWGGEVVHCPFCHGWEVRDRAIGVLASSPMAVHQALLFSSLTDDLIVFAHDQELTAGDRDRLAARGASVVDGEIAAVESSDGRLTGVRLVDGTRVAREVLAVQSRMVARAGVLADLSLRTVPHPGGMGEVLSADAVGRTDVPGVWAAGNVTDLSAQVGAAAAAGALAGAQLTMDLIAEDTVAAVEAARMDRTPAPGAVPV